MENIIVVVCWLSRNLVFVIFVISIYLIVVDRVVEDIYLLILVN